RGRRRCLGQSCHSSSGLCTMSIFHSAWRYWRSPQKKNRFALCLAKGPREPFKLEKSTGAAGPQRVLVNIFSSLAFPTSQRTSSVSQLACCGSAPQMQIRALDVFKKVRLVIPKKITLIQQKALTLRRRNRKLGY